MIRADAMIAVLLIAGCTENTLNPEGGGNTVAPRIEVDPGIVQFGEVPMSSQAEAVVTIRNEGNAGLTLDSIGIEGPLAFSYTWPEPVQMLAEGEATEVIVVYEPGAASETGWLTVHSDDPNRPQVDVSLNGSAGYGFLRIQPDPVEFSALSAGESRIEAVTLTNIGGDSLTVDSLAVLGTGFSISAQPELPLTIEPNTAVEGLEIAFSSFTDGIFDGILNAQTDAPQPSTTADLVAYVGLGNISGEICVPGNGGPAVGVRVWVEGTYPSGTPWMVEDWTDANGNFFLEDVPLGTHTVYAQRGSWSTSFELTLTGGTYELSQPECLDPDSAKVAVVTGDYDHIGAVLSTLAIEYDSYPGSSGSATYMQLLRDPELMATYDVIFFNCGMSFAWLDERDEVARNLRTFVREGGSVYASDWAWGVVEESWPSTIDFYGPDDTPWNPETYISGPLDPYVGVATNTPANVLDPNMAASVGPTADIYFDLDAWVVVQSAQASVLVSGEVTAMINWKRGTTEVLPNAPLVVRFDSGGTVIYTAFHNDQQATADARAILAQIILSL